MQLAAIWVQNHHLLGTTGINFGGRYFYGFELEGQPINNTNILKVSRKKNEKYIPDFYSHDNENLSLTSAIVGRNGTGKSTVLNTIRKIVHFKTIGSYNENYKFACLIFEHQDDSISTYTDSYRNRLGYDLRRASTIPPERLIINSDFITIKPELPKLETIYFSPFLDLKNSYFNSDDSVDIDISLDRLILNDSNFSDERSGRNQLINHRYQNVYRQIQLHKSEISKVLHKNYGIPLVKRVHFSIDNIHIDTTSFHNTPYTFRPFYEKLYEIWQSEIYATARQVTSETDLSEDKAIFKIWFLLGVIQSLFAPLEGSNHYLSEGLVRIKVSDLDNYSLKEALYEFLENHYFERSNNLFLPTEEIKNLIETTFSIIDNLEKNEIFDPKKMSINLNKSQSILECHYQFIDKMSFFDNNVVGFLDVHFGSRGFSSGEKAFLDLYSRFFHSIQLIKKRKNDQYEYNGDLPKFFILLLDEGDLGFHPVWKKKFVKSITDILPKFFEEFEGVQVQIIFTTHDALTLSDMPNYNVVYLDKIDEQITVLNPLENEGRPTKSFGANISDLLADSFFLEGGLVGDFAVAKIDNTIAWLNSQRGFEQPEVEYHRKMIDLIDEPIIKKKLSSMFSEKIGDSAFEQSIIIQQMKRLENQLRNLKNPEQ